MDDHSSKMQSISYIYQVVTDPLSFDKLLAEWDKAIDRSLELDSTLLDDPELADHTVRAATIIQQLQKAEIEPRPLRLSEIIAHDPNPALLLSKEGKVIAVNQSATTQLMVCEGQMLNDLADGTSVSPGKIFTLLQNIAQEEPSTTSSAQLSTRSMVGLLELSSSAGATPALFAVSKVHCEEDAAVAGLLTSLAPVWNPQTLAALSHYFELTAAEIEVIRLLADGQNAGQIAETRNTSLHTVRTQIKSILAKTRLESQLDLVRHLGFLQRYDHSTGLAPVADEKGDDPQSQMQRQRFMLKNGRYIDYVEIGPDTGAPVLFLHGLIDSTVFRSDFTEQLFKRGLKLIAPTRPGFDSSDPYQNPDAALDEFSNCLVQLLDHLRIKKVSILGHMAGTSYGVAFAANNPERVSSITSVAGALPMVDRWQFTAMSKGHRIAGLTARYMPSALPLLIRGGIRLVLGAQEERMLDLLFHDAHVDRELAKDPDIAKLIFDRFHFVVRQGPQAFQTDIKVVSSDWSDRSMKIECPLTLVHGEQDQVVLFRAAEEWATKLPNCTLLGSANSGQLVLFNEVDLILDQVYPHSK